LANRIITLTEKDSFIEQTVIIQDEDLERMGLLKKPKVDSKSNKQAEKVDDKKIPKMEANTISKNHTQVNATVPIKDQKPNKTSSNSTREKNSEVKRPHAPPGSNAWVISGNHTESGYPIVASDPHLIHKIPSIGYIASISIPNGPNLFGYTFPGIPWFGIATNDHAAWGITISYLETTDLYSIKHNKTHYFYNRTWVPLTIHRHKIRVKGGEPVYYESYHTHHGPILYQPASEEREMLLNIVYPAFMDKPIAYSWVGIREVDRTFKGYRMINEAKNINEFFEAAKMIDSVPFSLVFGTVSSCLENRGIMILGIGQRVRFLFERT